jgi:hypothetical protein
VAASPPLSTLLSHALVAYTIELDNAFELRLGESGHAPRVTSFVMWANALRFVGDGIAVADLQEVSGTPKSRMLSTLGGLERWGYVAVGPESKTRRDGYGSARGVRPDWTVRFTPGGRAAAEIWSPLPDEIEARWRDRFGASATDELRRLLEAVVSRLDRELPEYLPIIGSANGMVADAPSRERRSAPPRHLSALLAQVLLAYTIDFERGSELSLPLSANFVRVLDETGVGVKELPLRAGVSREATAMALTSLSKAGSVVLENKVVRLTGTGREAQTRLPRIHEGIESRWQGRFGADAAPRLRASLASVLDQREALVRGLEPPESGWRASRRYAERTRALVADPTGALPHYPMVLHRGGWPDGS